MMTSTSSSDIPSDVPLIVQGYHVSIAQNEGRTVKPEVIDHSYERSSSSPAVTGASTTTNDALLGSSPAVTGASTTTNDALLGNQTRQFLKTMDSSRGVGSNDFRDLIEKLVHQNEILLASNEASILKPNPRRKFQDTNYTKSVTPQTEKTYLSGMSISHSTSTVLPVGKAAIAKVAKNVGKQTIEHNVLQYKGHNIAGTLLRPKSPTRTCKIPKEDKDHFTHALMEVAHSETSSFNLSSHELFCAVSAPFSFQTKAGVLVSNLDMKHYWCNFCPFQTDEKAQILGHVVTHRFHCRYCTYQSFSRIDVIKHTGSVHDEFLETFKSMTYCALLPDYLQVQIMQKEKRKGDTAEYTPEKKKARLPEDGQKAATKVSTVKERLPNEDYEMFEMEVEEIDETADESEEIRGGSHPCIDTSSSKIQEASQCKISSVISGSDAVNTLLSEPNSHSNEVITTTLMNPVPMPSMINQVPMPPMINQVPVNLIGQPKLPMLHLPGIAQPQLAMFINGPVVSNSTSLPMTYLTQAPIGNAQAPQPAVMVPTRLAPVPNSLVQNMAKRAPPASQVVNMAQTEPREGSQQTVSSNLAWTCGYCSFSAAQQSALKTHLNMKHTGMTHKYVAVLVNSGDKQQLKNSDKTVSPKVYTPPPTVVQTPPIVVQNEPAEDKAVENVDNIEKIDGDQAVVHSSSSDEYDEDESDEEYLPGSENKSPLTSVQRYQCQHCPIKSSTLRGIRKHIIDSHKRTTIMAIDLTAERRKKNKNVYFCVKDTCTYSTKSSNKYLKHAEVCTPFLPTDTSERSVSLQLTMKAASKAVVLSQGHGYACVYCNFRAANILAVRLHTTAIHKNEQIMIEDLKSAALRRKKYTYFCRTCTWEGRLRTDLNLHEAKEHGISPPEIPDDSSDIGDDDTADDSSSTMSDKPAVNKTTTDSLVTTKLAIKAQILCRSQGSSQRQFRCRQCHFTCLGIDLMRKHLSENHVGCLLSAIDMQKENQRQSSTVFLCPQEECSFYNRFMETVESHALEVHDLTYKFPRPGGRAATILIQQQPVVVPVIAATSSTGSNKYAPAFECLYCSTTTITTSMQKMKEHILADHKGEEVVMRDCVAWKLHKHSRLYMCFNVNCTYTTNDNMDYVSHIGAHKGTLLRECKHCKHYTETSELIHAHLKEKHRDKVIIFNEVMFNFDKKGSIYKKIVKVKVKEEKV